jgi:tetratricopeptide (TPR) repeat protein
MSADMVGGTETTLRNLCLPISLAIALASIGPSFADQATDECFSLGAYSSNYVDKPEAVAPALKACTTVIAARKRGATPASLAAAYSARGSWYTKSFVLKVAGTENLDLAIADLDEAVKLNPKNVEFYDYRADAWQFKGDLDRAIANYDQANRVDPQYAAAYFSRGRVYQQKGDMAHARADYAAALAVPNRDRIAAWAQQQARQALDALDKSAPK